MDRTSRARSGARREPWERDAVFEVSDLACRGCARHAEGALRRVEGVRGAQVSFVAELAQVLYDARATSERDIGAAMARAGFRLRSPSGLPAIRALRQDRAAFVAAMLVFAVLLALSAVPGARWTGLARAAGAGLLLGLGAAPLARRGAALGRRGQLALDAPVLAAALLAFLAGALELWATAPGAAPPAQLAALGLRRDAWQAARPLGFELCGLLVTLAIGARCAYVAARERATAALSRGADASEAALADVRRALALVDRPDVPPLRRAPGAPGAPHPAPPGEGFLDVAAQALCVAAPALAAFALVVHATLGGGPLSPAALLAPIAVLAGCSPAAFWLAAPAARALAMARARAAGILVKHPRALEAVAQTSAVCLERAGTVTAGTPRVTGLRWIRPPERRLLEDLLTLELRAAHPAGRAIAAFLGRLGVRPAEGAVAAPVLEGRGAISGCVRGQLLEIGAPARWTGDLHREADPSASVAWFTRNGEVFGCFELHDPLRPGVEAVLGELVARGLTPRILGGDRSEAIPRAGHRPGVQGFGGLSSAAKALHVRDLQRAGARVLFVGSPDGAWTAQADASVTLAQTSSPASIPTAIVIAGDRLEPLAYLVDLSRALRARLREGAAASALFNAAVLPCAALGWLPPAAAAALALVEALAVLANAGRLPRPPAVGGARGRWSLRCPWT